MLDFCKRVIHRARLYDQTITVLPAVGLIAFLIMLYLAPDSPLLNPDSVGYLEADPGRTKGYPIFLSILPYDGIMAAQILVFVICAFIFARQVRSILVFVLLVANPLTYDFHVTVMTESLFMSVSLLFLAAIVQRGATSYLAAIILAGVATTIRPSAIPLVIVPVLLCLIQRQWISGVIGTSVWAALLMVSASSSHLASIHLFAKASLIEAPAIDTRGMSLGQIKLAKALDYEFAEIRRVLAEAEGQRFRQALQVDYEVCIQRPCSNHLPVEHRLEMALRRISLNPLGFASLTLENFRGLWLFGSRTTDAQDYDNFIIQRQPLPFQEDFALVGYLPPTTESDFAKIFRPVFILAGILAALALFIPDSRVRIALSCAFTLQAFTAATGVGIPRYTLSLWPFFAAAIVFAIHWISKVQLGRVPLKNH